MFKKKLLLMLQTQRDTDTTTIRRRFPQLPAGLIHNGQSVLSNIYETLFDGSLQVGGSAALYTDIQLQSRLSGILDGSAEAQLIISMISALTETGTSLETLLFNLNIEQSKTFNLSIVKEKLFDLSLFLKDIV